MVKRVSKTTVEAYKQALNVLDDPERSFVLSVYVRLEALPNAIFFGREEEVEVLRTARRAEKGL